MIFQCAILYVLCSPFSIYLRMVVDIQGLWTKPGVHGAADAAAELPRAQPSPLPKMAIQLEASEIYIYICIYMYVCMYVYIYL